MSDVNRDPIRWERSMTQDKDGQYVSYHDYAVLLDSLDLLSAELDEARRLIDEARRQEPFGWVMDNGRWSKEQPSGLDSLVLSTMPVFAAAPVPAQPSVPDDAAKDAACWKQLTLAHKFNNHPVVGFAINRAKEKAAILSATDAEVKK